MTATRSHLALYRRWRAQTFDQIVGQTPVVETLRNAVRTGRLAHALLFVGPRGTGKTSLARIVAKAINCLEPRDGEPCDRCVSCVAIREGRALDVIELDAASNNRVDDIRELLPRIYTAPSDLARKVFIVDEVQRIKEGWDLLLKTLEEPPGHVLFVFCTTDSSQIRPAVLSRVQRFDFRRLAVAEIEGKLRTILSADDREADDDAVVLIARLAAGGMRDAESMLDQLLSSGDGRITADQVRELLGLAEADEVDGFARALVERDAASGLAILAGLEEHGRDLRTFLDQVVDELRIGIVDGLVSGRDPSAVQPIAIAAARLAAIDPTRAGPGGLRFQLELALLEGGPAAPAAPSSAAPPPPADLVATVVEASPAPPPAPRARAQRTSAAKPAPGSGLDPGPARDAPPPVGSPPPSPADATPTAGPAPAVAAGPEEPQAEPGSRGGASSPDASALGALRDQWPEIVTYISQHPPTKPLISACRPVAVEGAVVTLGFPEGQAFLKDVAERRRGNLEEGIGHFLGRSVTVRCIATNVDTWPDLPADEEGTTLVSEARRIFADELADVGEVG
jgi:DNA polymerase-3 subunit gamma/tau